MKTIDFNVSLRDINQEQITDKKLAHVLCEVLGSATKSENPMKLYGWYLELNKTGVLTLDNTDKKLLYNFIENNENVFLFVKGQLLDLLDSKDEPKK